MAWGMLIASYLFLAGISAGAYILATMCQKLWPDKDLKTVEKAGIYLSFPLVALGSVFLMLDAEAGIKAPWRFFLLLSNIPSSMISNGTLIISLFMLVSAVSILKVYQGKPLPRWLTNVGIALALGTAAYTGFLIGVLNAVPIWNNSVLPLLFVASAMSTGIAGTLILATGLDRKVAGEIKSIKKLHLSLLAGELALLFTLIYITSTANVNAAQSVSMLVSGQFNLMFWGGLIAIGLLFPIAVDSFELFGRLTGGHSLPLFYASEAAVLAGGFVLRYLLLAVGAPVTLL